MCALSASRPTSLSPQFCDVNVADNALPNVTVAECLTGSCASEAVRFYTAPLDRLELVPSDLSSTVLPFLGRSHWMDCLTIWVEGSELGGLQGLTRSLTASGFPRSCLSSVPGPKSELEGNSPAQHKLFCIRWAIGPFDFGVAENPVC
jgi:hypothetical protein